MKRLRRLRCFFLGHESIIYPRHGKPQVYCKHCPDYHSYTIREWLEIAGVEALKLWKRAIAFWLDSKDEDEDEMPF